MRSPQQITMERVREALSSLARDVENAGFKQSSRMIRLSAEVVNLELRDIVDISKEPGTN